MQLITLKVFDNTIDLHIVKARLESENICCFVFDENVVTVNPLYNIAVGGIKLKVREEDLEKASNILEEIGQSTFHERVKKVTNCPNCDSENIISDDQANNGFISSLIKTMSSLFSTNRKVVYTCRNCGHKFAT